MLCVKLGSQRTRLCICARKANSVPYASVSSDLLVLSLSIQKGEKGATNYGFDICAIVIAKHVANRVASYDFTSSHYHTHPLASA